MKVVDMRRKLRKAAPGLPDGLLDEVMTRVLRCSRRELYSRPEKELSEDSLERLLTRCDRLKEGEPIQLLLGTVDFFGLELELEPGVLIPRPETEALVDLTLAHLPPDTKVLDLGTGCGAVALAVKSERPDATVVGVDIDEKALEVARKNSRKLDLDVEWVQGNWCQPVIDRSFDMVLANPPYVESGFEGLKDLLRYEPESALVSGPTGLEAIAQIIVSVRIPGFLNPGGWLFMEHGAGRSMEVRTLLENAGYDQCRTHPDLDNRDRFSGGCLP